MLTGEQVGRCEEGALEPVPRGRGEGPGRDGGLAASDIALEEAEHRRLPREVVADGVDRPVLVDRQRDVAPELPAERAGQRAAQAGVGRFVDRDWPGGV